MVSPSGDDGCGFRPVLAGRGAWSRARVVRGHGAGSGRGERVVAELGQDVAGLPDDLAGLRQGGALGVLAVGDGGVVAVVGGRSAGAGLPASYTAQRSTGGPCRDSRPGGPLRSEDRTVMSSPVNRTALREEENRSCPGQPAGQRQRGDRARPIQPLGQHLRAHQAPGGLRVAGGAAGPAGLRWRRACPRRWRPAAARPPTDARPRPRAAPARPGSVRSAPFAQRRGALMEEHRVDAYPGGVRGAQVVVGLQQRPVLQDLRRRDPAFRQPPLGQKRPQVPESVLSVLACRLRPRSAAVSAGSPRCAAIPAAASSSATYRQPVHPSTANATSSGRRTGPARPARAAGQPGRSGRACTSPVTVSR